MSKYKVVYFSEYKGPFELEIEAWGVREHKGEVVFYDEHGEDEYIFNKDDVVVYYRI